MSPHSLCPVTCWNWSRIASQAAQACQPYGYCANRICSIAPTMPLAGAAGEWQNRQLVILSSLQIITYCTIQTRPQLALECPMERRLAAILAADVKGYSHLTELNEEASTATLRMYRAVVEESISAHRGHVFSSAGDGVVAEFPSVVEAIRCGVEIQNEIAERNVSVPENGRMQFRIGVNLGDVIAEENNLYGTGVNVAVRLEQLAEAGGICISQTVYDQVRKIVEIPFEDIGEHRLKNITEPVHVYRILPSPLPWVRRFLSRTVAQPAPRRCRWRPSIASCSQCGSVLSASAGWAMGHPSRR